MNPEIIFLGALKRKCWLLEKPILETAAVTEGPEITVFDFDLGNKTVELVRHKVGVELGKREMVTRNTEKGRGGIGGRKEEKERVKRRGRDRK